ncbi:hypothetical protein [Desulfovibrio sp. UCD-KL4C]|uniref:hypothetical protein n=1 Tax=Desulfovibrio sp. UCD-KL4C TaxID=2578120 RepID=UPI0025BAFD6F|nr:hypothetical protein [Desulfovibrio sp. UCD-KL4C]
MYLKILISWFCRRPVILMWPVAKISALDDYVRMLSCNQMVDDLEVSVDVAVSWIKYFAASSPDQFTTNKKEQRPSFLTVFTQKIMSTAEASKRLVALCFPARVYTHLLMFSSIKYHQLLTIWICTQRKGLGMNLAPVPW